jgi:pimeloyl-ACP methyl ester carboxylesterase
MTFRKPFEIELGDGSALRGVVIEGGSAPTLVLVHDLGGDLDEFGQLPELLATHGGDVIAIDLPGHGLSDGDGDGDGDRAAIVEAIASLVAALSDGGQPVGLIASGRSSTLGMILGERHGVRVQVLINPILDEGLLACGVREYSQRMVLHAEGEQLVGTATKAFYSPLIGEKLLLHSALVADGPTTIVEHSVISDQVALFLRRYLFSPMSPRGL